MKTIDAKELPYQELNKRLRQCEGEAVKVENCLGQRYMGCARKSGDLYLEGTPGNGLAAYLDGARIVLDGNAQDATGDTMNGGEVLIHGRAGDATGYAMRGGAIYVQGDVGYRAGIHMKAYGDAFPVVVIGGSTGSFLGEYLAGGLIVVLGIGSKKPVPTGYFCGTGMHGGKIVLRCDRIPEDLPKQVEAHRATGEDLAELMPYLQHYAEAFGANVQELASGSFYVLTPDTKNPYKRLYIAN